MTWFYIDIGLDELLPLNLLGSGMVRATNVMAYLLLHNEKILILDELENGLHHRAVSSFLRALLALSRNENVQIIASTQRLGVLRSLLDVLDEDTFSKHRHTTRCYALRRDREGLVRSYRYEYDQYEHCVRHGIEIR